MLLKDRLEYYNGTVTPGGTWTLISALNNPASFVIDGTPTLLNIGNTVGTNDNPDVSFVNTHSDVFEYRVSCGAIVDTSTLSVRNVIGQPSDDCTSSTTVQYPVFEDQTKTTSSLYIFECATDYVVESPASTNQNPPTWPLVRNGDVWLRFTTNSVTDVTIKVTGIESGMLALYSGGCTVNTFTLIHDQVSLTNIIETPVLTLLPNTSYYIRLSCLPFVGIDHYAYSVNLTT